MERKRMTIILEDIPAKVVDAAWEVASMQANKAFGITLKPEDTVTINFKELDEYDPSQTLGAQAYSQIFSAVMMSITSHALHKKLNEKESQTTS